MKNDFEPTWSYNIYSRVCEFVTFQTELIRGSVQLLYKKKVSKHARNELNVMKSYTNK